MERALTGNYAHVLISGTMQQILQGKQFSKEHAVS